MARHAGLMLPLFAASSSRSWGIGEFTDLVPLAAWMGRAGFDRLMLLPIGTMAAGESSPYSAVSARALDPIFIALDEVEDFVRAGGEQALSAEAVLRLQAAREAPSILYADVRHAKHEGLVRAFERFAAEEWEQHTPRAAELAAYIARERAWLEDYALFQAIVDERPGVFWPEWEAPLARRDPRALDRARRELAREVLRQQYWQWLAESQWQKARAGARGHGVLVMGDLPFAVAGQSADVWARQDEFDLEISVGVPPDEFSEDGQDWGLPAYRWDVIARSGYAWMRERVSRTATLFDGVRIDHLVGLYRTYGKPRRGRPFFSPAREPDQIRQGEAVLRIFLDGGLEVVAEDLGTVPDFVRDSLRRLGVPGCRVLRWERDWDAPGEPFRDPAAYPSTSAAMTGTHDTTTMAAWWTEAEAAERRAIARLPVLRARGPFGPDDPWTPRLGDALLEQAYHTGSDQLFVPMQDVFGWTDRINIPSTVGDHNWTWRLRWPVDRLLNHPEAMARAAVCRRFGSVSGRTRVE